MDEAGFLSIEVLVLMVCVCDTGFILKPQPYLSSGKRHLLTFLTCCILCIPAMSIKECDVIMQIKLMGCKQV